MKRVIEKLIEEGKTISMMESCTGGGLADALTSVPNASKVYYGSVIAYSNRDKIKNGIPPELIKKYGVYSQDVAEAMAKAICENEEVDYGIGVTGKFKAVDENNLNGDDDVVFVTIYDRENDEYHNMKFQVSSNERKDMKREVIDAFIEKFLEITKNKTK